MNFQSEFCIDFLLLLLKFSCVRAAAKVFKMQRCSCSIYLKNVRLESRKINKECVLICLRAIRELQKKKKQQQQL
jgi:hypothetical protein